MTRPAVDDWDDITERHVRASMLPTEVPPPPTERDLDAPTECPPQPSTLPAADDGTTERCRAYSLDELRAMLDKR